MTIAREARSSSDDGDVRRPGRRPLLVACIGFLIPLAASCARLDPATNSPVLSSTNGQSRAVREMRDACVLRETARTRLAIDGAQEAYVEPVIVSASGDEVLLAGKPSYVWSKAPDGSGELQSRNELFGVIVGNDGRVRVVTSPLPGRPIAPLAATPLGAGAWGILYAEFAAMDERASWYFPDSVVQGVSYSEYDGEKWGEPERLPLPRAERIVLWAASALASGAGILTWAVPVVPAGHSIPAAVSVFKREQGAWAHEAVPIRIPGEVEMAFSKRLGFVLAIVHADTTVPSDGNSLFFYTRRGTWQQLRKVVAGGWNSPMQNPTLTLSDNGEGVLTWAAPSPGIGNQARAMTGRIEERNEPLVTVDPQVLDRVSDVADSNGHLWVSNHLGDDGKSREVRVSRLWANEVFLVGSFANPYEGYFRASSIARSELLIAGPLFEPSRGMVSTLLLRARVDCDPASDKQ